MQCIASNACIRRNKYTYVSLLKITITIAYQLARAHARETARLHVLAMPRKSCKRAQKNTIAGESRANPVELQEFPQPRYDGSTYRGFIGSCLVPKIFTKVRSIAWISRYLYKQRAGTPRLPAEGEGPGPRPSEAGACTSTHVFFILLGPGISVGIFIVIPFRFQRSDSPGCPL